MTTAMVTPKSTGLVKTGGAVRQLATKLERARQRRNERIARADAEYVNDVQQAAAAIADMQTSIDLPDGADSDDVVNREIESLDA